MGIGATLVRKQERTSRPEIKVVGVHVRLIMRREVIQNRAAWTDLLDAISVVKSTRVRVEGPVASDEVDVSRRVSGETSTAVPDPAGGSIRSGVVFHHELEGGGVESQYPAVVRRLISMRCERDIHHAVKKEERGSLILS